jgi:hypothetical protein
MKRCFCILMTFLLTLNVSFTFSIPAARAETMANVNYLIINRNSGKLLDVSECSKKEGARVLQWKLNGGTNQQWKLADAGDGYVKIVNSNSGKLLEVRSASAGEKSAVVQGNERNSKNQQWELVDADGGYRKIVNRHSGKLLDIEASSIADGGNAIQNSKSGENSQQWYLATQTSGNVTYRLIREQNPTQDQLDAYQKIKTAMDQAVLYYNNLTNISKQITVYYNPSVSTADASSNGTIRFGKSRSYMTTCTALHEIAHTVGVGQSNGWFSLIKNGVYTGTHATAQLKKITGLSSSVLHGDNMHFWPFGLNYASEVKTDADFINHCRIINQMKKDGV